MGALNRWSRIQFLALIVLSLFASKPVAAEFPNTQTDGWYTWRVTAAAAAPNWCCYSWNSGVAREKTCDLDSSNHGFSSSDDETNNSDELQVYLKMASGNVTDIRAMSAQCPVTSRSAITDLGVIATNDSIDRLQASFDADEDVASGALAAVSAHAGKRSLDLLLATARKGKNLELRKEAVFWTAMIRGPEAADDIAKLMFSDSNPDFREHVAFAYSQSDIENRSAALIKLGKQDANAEVRSQAWFWLAQTGAPEAEAEISRAIAHDKNSDVREEAVFALSQLPDDRAVKALAAVLENQKLDREIREQALFWLAQSDSDQAFAYVDRLFGG